MSDDIFVGVIVEFSPSMASGSIGVAGIFKKLYGKYE
jgi:hypothetical protein